MGGSCCGGGPAADGESAEKTRELVRLGYAKVATAGSLGGAVDGGCCGGSPMRPEALAERLGYAASELAWIPQGANMGLSCGNPTAIAALREGEVVLDLGAGGGFDCFLAGPKVGATGRVIGVDMTPEMLSKARAGIASYRATTDLDNVEFRLGEIEHLPVADASVDVVISNCVINLSPDKPQVFREIARVLRSGGRVAVSDIALFRPLPDEVKTMVEALVGCVAGAVSIDEYRRMLEDAGLVDVTIEHKPEYAASLEDAEDPLFQRIAAALPAGSKIADFVTSIDVAARRV